MSEDQNTETHAVADASIGAGTELNYCEKQ